MSGIDYGQLITLKIVCSLFSIVGSLFVILCFILMKGTVGTSFIRITDTCISIDNVLAGEQLDSHSGRVGEL